MFSLNFSNCSLTNLQSVVRWHKEPILFYPFGLFSLEFLPFRSWISVCVPPRVFPCAAFHGNRETIPPPSRLLLSETIFPPCVSPFSATKLVYSELPTTMQTKANHKDRTLSKKSAPLTGVMRWQLNSCTVWLQGGFRLALYKRKTMHTDRYFSKFAAHCSNL